MSTLKSIGRSENGPDECACKTTEARHRLACAVLLRSACACVFSLVFGFYRHSVCCRCGIPRRLAGATDGNARVRKLGYETNNCILSRKLSSSAYAWLLGAVLMAAECGL